MSLIFTLNPVRLLNCAPGICGSDGDPDLDLPGGRQVDVEGVPRDPPPLPEDLLPVLRPQPQLDVDFGVAIGLRS